MWTKSTSIFKYFKPGIIKGTFILLLMVLIQIVLTPFLSPVQLTVYNFILAMAIFIGLIEIIFFNIPYMLASLLAGNKISKRIPMQKVRKELDKLIIIKLEKQLEKNKLKSSNKDKS